jgi:hypothetical protein
MRRLACGGGITQKANQLDLRPKRINMNDMKFTTAGEYMGDESHLPVAEQSLVFRLRKRAEIRRQIKDRKSVQEGQPDRIADLLEEAANKIDQLTELLYNKDIK